MCDEHDHEHAAGPRFARGRFSRRQVLQGAVALAALAGCSAPGRGQAAPFAGRAVSSDGLTARTLAMHLHASSSEGVGSVRSQLVQAAANGFDVAWFTDHDWRRRRLAFRQSYSFTANELQVGGTWNVPKMSTVGSAVSGSGGTLVATPVSPADPSQKKGSLRMRVTSTGTSPAVVRNRINAESTSRQNFRGRIAGRRMLLEVNPTQAGVDAWGEVFLRLSHSPALGGRAAGIKTVLYRLRTDISSVAHSTAGLKGFVDVPVRAAQWQTVTIDPLEDAGLLWPDERPEDNSLNEIEFHAVSRRKAVADVLYGYLRFVEDTGYEPVGVETTLLEHYATVIPGVLGLNGTEISLGPHINQYGGPQDPYDYGPLTAGLRSKLDGIRADVIRHIHDSGGLACINHPFKPGDGNANISPTQLAASLIGTRLDGADLMEVGYASKGTNGTLAAHLAVWDAVSRNGLFVTGNGVSDDHSGQNWVKQTNRFFTGAWSSAATEGSLVDALAVGRSYVGLLGAFRGSIDMALGAAPMGSVALGPANQRTLRVDVQGLPSGAAVEVLRGRVDYAGSGQAQPNTTVEKTLDATQLAGGWETSVSTEEECFYRLQVLDGSGAVIGFGQPTWSLRELRSATGDPRGRLVRD